MRLAVVAPKKMLVPLVARLTRTKISSGIVPIARRTEKRGTADPYGILAVAESCPPKTGGLLLVIPRRMSVLRAIPSAVMSGKPVGLLQADGMDDLLSWCDALDVCSQRHAPSRTYAPLAMNTMFFKSQGALLAKSIRRAYRLDGAAKNLFADTIVRDDLLEELAKGPSLVTYLGHGSQQGWGGYRGVDGRRVAVIPQIRPCGTVISISCDTLVQNRAEISFGSRFVAGGRACAYLGAAGKVKMDSYADFVRMMNAVISRRPRTMGELMVRMDDDVSATENDAMKRDWAFYRLIGNPLQSII